MPKRILALDDSRTILAAIKIGLGKKGYSVDTASNGDDALRMLNESVYDVIFTDYNMPEMGGIHFIRRVRRLAEPQSKIPIIVLTTESERAKKVQGKIVGANGWLIKPFTADQLATAVEELV